MLDKQWFGIAEVTFKVIWEFRVI